MIALLPRKGRKWGKQRIIVAQKDVVSAIPSIGNASGPEGLFSAAGLEKGRSTRRSFGSRRPRSQVTMKEGSGHTSAMVALYLPINMATTVAAAAIDMFGDRAEVAEELHITLAYLGKAIQLEPRLPYLVPLIQRYAQIWLETVGEPINVLLAGYNSFPTVQEDGSIAIYREVVSPLLQVWVEGLWRVLDFAGITTHRDHEKYTPHVTVAYTYPELATLLPALHPVYAKTSLRLVTLVLGDMHIDLPLAPGMATLKAATDDSGQRIAANGGGAKPSGAPTSAGGHEQISPGVYRIRGNLCQVHGKFGPCDSASSEGFDKKPKKGKGKGKGGKGAKPKLTDAERKAKHQADRAERLQQAEAEHAQNRTASLAKLSNRPNDKAMGVLDALRQGGQPDQAMVESMEATGLVKKHSDGSYTLSSSGHGLLNALDRGDAGAAAEAIAGGKDQVASNAERQHATTERQTARAQAKADRAQAKAQREAQRQTRQRQTAERRARVAKSPSTEDIRAQRISIARLRQGQG